MKKIGILYGALTGSVNSIVMLTAFFNSIQTRHNRYITLITISVIFLGLMFTIMKAKKFNGGEIEFKRALGVGFSSGLTSTFVFTLVTFLYYTFLNPNFADKYLVDIEISLKAAGKTGLALQNEMNAWRQDMSVQNQTFKVFVTMSLLSLFMAAINALILCKKD